MRKNEREILTHEFNVGDMVRWMDEYETFHYGRVASIDDMTLQVTYGPAKRLFDATELSLADDIKGKQRFTKTELKAKAVEVANSKGWTEMLSMWDDEKKPGEPGRRTDVRKVDVPDYARRIIDIVVEAGEFMTPAYIKSKLGDELSAAAWNKAVDEALRSSEIIKTGKRRGTMYGPPGAEVKPSAKKATGIPEDVATYADKMEAFINSKGEPQGKSEIVKAIGDSPAYSAAIKLLVDTERVVRTGAKRGTKYGRMAL